MKTLIFFVFTMLSMLSYAETNSVVPDPRERRLKKAEFLKLSPQQRKIYLDRLSYLNNGGHLVKENTGAGVVKIIIASNSVDADILETPLSRVERFMKINIDILKGDKVSVEDAKDKMLGYKANVAVFVIEDKKLPRLLSAPEEGWAILNISSLKNGNITTDVFNRRVIKEIMRATSLATGCMNVGACMQPVTDIKSLDLLMTDSYPLNVRAQIYKTLNEFGIEPRVEASYKVACQQGWAPAPTNDVQKAIWDKIHAVPKNPMKIEFDPKKGR